MKLSILLLFFTFSVLISYAQSNSPGYVLTIEFAPSFTSASRLIVKSNHDSSFVKLMVYKNYVKNIFSFQDSLKLNNDELLPLNDFLKNYKFKIRRSLDTIVEKNRKNGKLSLDTSFSIGTDGITVTGVLEQKNTSRKFQFWSPKKGTDNEKFIEILFNILNEACKKESYIKYITKLKGYFPIN